MSSRWKVCGVFVAGAFVIVAIDVLSLLLAGGEGPFPIAYKSAGPIPFEKARWADRQSSLFTASPRLRMAKTLVAEKKLVGATEANVRALLGAPDAKDRPVRDTWMSYHLQNRGAALGGDPAYPSDWLVLRRSGDVVSEAEIVTEK